MRPVELVIFDYGGVFSVRMLAGMETYQAIMLTGRGGPEVLERVSLPVTNPGAGQVRLAVRATGAGGTDVTMRRGSYSFAPPYPFVPGYEASGWYGIVAPKGTPPAIVDRLNKQINAALDDAGMKARLADLGCDMLAGSPADFAKFIEDETRKWAEVIKFTGVTAE